MATKTKHMERSHRSYHNPKPFASFERKAEALKGQKAQKVQKASLRDKLKSLYHRTTNK